MSQAAGYEWSEGIYLKEAAYNTKDTSASLVWKNIMLITDFDPQPRHVYREKIGIGTQQPSDFPLLKKDYEVVISHKLLAKSTTPAWEWYDFFSFIVGAEGATALANRIDSFSLQLKRNIATPQYEFFTGCKIREFQISGRNGEEVQARATILGQNHKRQTTDEVNNPVVVPAQTRQAQPSTLFVKWSDIDILYKGVSVLDRVSTFDLIFPRNLVFTGSKATDALQWRSLEEQERDIRADLTFDFKDTTEWDDLVTDTAGALTFQIPRTVGSGRQLALSGFKFQRGRRPVRETQLVAAEMSGRATGVTITTL